MFTLQVEHYDTITSQLKKYNNEFKVADVLTIVKTESNFFSSAKSSKGAIGLMQIKVDTANFIFDNMTKYEKVELLKLRDNYYNQMQNIGSNLASKKAVITEKDLTIPSVNIMLGVWYINYLSGKFNSKIEVLSAYNAGENVVKKWLNDGLNYKKYPYKETRDYIRKNLFYQKMYNIKLAIIKAINK